MDLYENEHYKNDRVNKQTVSVMVPSFTTIKNTKFKLREPLILDSITEVYLDSIVFSGETSTASVAVAHPETDLLVMKIDELECKNIGATLEDDGYNEPQSITVLATNEDKRKTLLNSVHNSIIIPNIRLIASAATNLRGNKYNYISTLNPRKINTLTISLGWLQTVQPSQNLNTEPGDDELFTVSYEGVPVTGGRVGFSDGMTIINLVFVSKN